MVRTGDTSYLDALTTHEPKPSAEGEKEKGLTDGSIPFVVRLAHSPADSNLSNLQVDVVEEEKKVVTSNAQLDVLLYKHEPTETEDGKGKEKDSNKGKVAKHEAFPAVEVDGSLRVQLNLLPLLASFKRTKKTLLIIVADRSGSMQGKPWSQVLFINLFL